jgi:hypothetical protein
LWRFLSFHPRQATTRPPALNYCISFGTNGSDGAILCGGGAYLGFDGDSIIAAADAVGTFGSGCVMAGMINIIE